MYSPGGKRRYPRWAIVVVFPPWPGGSDLEKERDWERDRERLLGVLEEDEEIGEPAERANWEIVEPRDDLDVLWAEERELGREE